MNRAGWCASILMILAAIATLADFVGVAVTLYLLTLVVLRWS